MDSPSDSLDHSTTSIVTEAPARLAPSDWALLVDTGPVDIWCAAWLRIQSEWIGAVVRAVVCRRSSPDAPPHWLAERSSEDRIVLAAQIDATFQERTGLAAPVEGEEGRFGVSYFGDLPGDASFVVVVEVEVEEQGEVERDSEKELALVLRQLQWGAIWLERRLGGSSSVAAIDGSAGPAQTAALIDLIALTLDAKGFEEAAQGLVAQLARLLVCDRVSLGVEERGRIKLAALSHAAAFGREMNLVRALESAMDEAIDQNATLGYPIDREDAPIVVREHAALARDQGAGSVLTIPLGRGDALRGALLFEHAETGVFTAERVAALEAIALAVTPILDLWRREDRPLWKKILAAAGEQLSRLVGPGYLGRKLAIAIGVILVVFFSLATGDYRVAAEGSLEGASRRVVIAPFEGYVASSERRAGDFVETGEVLATLDDRELELERLKWSSRLVQLTRQTDESRAAREYGRTRILGAQIDEARAELARLEERLARTKVTAPFAGLVVSGDLSQSLGAAISRGDVLFEIAPLASYRILLEVDEQQIADVGVGQSGTLLLAAVPNEPLEFAVTKVTPVATAEDGRNYFRVEGTLVETSDRLRPGMEGVGKIDIDRRHLIWIWTRGFRDWAKLWVWSWWP